MNCETGIKRLNDPRFQFAISYDDCKCPYCGGNMKLDSASIKGNQINIRYMCKDCGLILPIKHNDDNPNIICPLADNSIFLFLSSFGKDIRERRYSY